MNTTGSKHLDGKGFDATQSLTLLPPVKGMNNMLPPDMLQQYQARRLEYCEWNYDENNFVATRKMTVQNLSIDGVDSSHFKALYNFQEGLTEEVIAFARKDGKGYIIDVLNKKIISVIEDSKSDSSAMVKWNGNFMIVNGYELYEIFSDGHNELRTIFYNGREWEKKSSVLAPFEVSGSPLINGYRPFVSVFDGKFVGTFPTTRTWWYDYSENTFTAQFIQAFSGCVTDGKKVYGVTSNPVALYEVDPSTWLSTKIADAPPTGGIAHSPMCYHNGYIYFFGNESISLGSDGFNYTISYSSTSWKFNLSSKLWVRIADIPGRYFNSTAFVFNGKICIIGGVSWSQITVPADRLSSLAEFSNRVVMYDTVANTYTHDAPLTYSACLISATVVEDRFFYTGGVGTFYTGTNSSNDDTSRNVFIYPGTSMLNIANKPVFPVNGLPHVIAHNRELFLFGAQDSSVYTFPVPREQLDAKVLLVKDGRVVVSQGDSLFYSGVGDSTMWNDTISDSDDGGLFLQVGYKEKSDIIYGVHAAGNIVLWKDNGYIYVVKGSYPDWEVLQLAQNEFITTNAVSIGGEVVYGTETGLKKLSTTSAYGDYVITRFQNEIKDFDAKYLHVSKSRNSLLVSTKDALYEFNIDTQAWTNLGSNKYGLDSFVTFRDTFPRSVIMGIRGSSVLSTPYGTSQALTDWDDKFYIAFSRELAEGRILIKRIVLYCHSLSDDAYRKVNPIVMSSNSSDTVDSDRYPVRTLKFFLEDRFKHGSRSFKIIKNQIMTTEAFMPEFTVPSRYVIDKIEVKYVLIGNQ